MRAFTVKPAACALAPGLASTGLSSSARAASSPDCDLIAAAVANSVKTNAMFLHAAGMFHARMILTKTAVDGDDWKKLEDEVTTAQKNYDSDKVSAGIAALRHLCFEPAKQQPAAPGASRPPCAYL